MNSEIILILENVRSAHNVGSILRSANGFGVNHVYCIGITPYPRLNEDSRLPHVIERVGRQIEKTALKAHESIVIEHHPTTKPLLKELQASGYTVVALEQTPSSIMLPDYTPPTRLALVVGTEVTGVMQSTIKQADVCLEIPMYGNKESLNVSVATAVALYGLQHPG